MAEAKWMLAPPDVRQGNRRSPGADAELQAHQGPVGELKPRGVRVRGMRVHSLITLDSAEALVAAEQTVLDWGAVVVAGVPTVQVSAAAMAADV